MPVWVKAVLLRREATLGCDEFDGARKFDAITQHDEVEYGAMRIAAEAMEVSIVVGDETRIAVIVERTAALPFSADPSERRPL
jgi:hypothetical protein